MDSEYISEILKYYLDRNIIIEINNINHRFEGIIRWYDTEWLMENIGVFEKWENAFEECINYAEDLLLQ
jgi:hypothetical protein